MSEQHTREPQYQNCVEIRDAHGLTSLGMMANQVWRDDPRRLTFLLARYKFVSKMFGGMDRVLEIGCADAFGTRIVLQEVKRLTAVDFDPVFVQDANERMDPRWPFECRQHDILGGPVDGVYDGIFSLDVIEHIAPDKEGLFLGNIAASLAERGVLIVGSPSLQSQAHASPPSKAGHVNCKDGPELKAALKQYFHNVFVFSMNDEVVHTGYYPMAHYLLALCCAKK
jgi:2-polyprenyl-3-methyl-5-hydroxy-6-metoxy-1,4-benzoquinol methylase